jgi:hypothetical protein
MELTHLALACSRLGHEERVPGVIMANAFCICINLNIGILNQSREVVVKYERRLAGDA